MNKRAIVICGATGISSTQIANLGIAGNIVCVSSKNTKTTRYDEMKILDDKKMIEARRALKDESIFRTLEYGKKRRK